MAWLSGYTYRKKGSVNATAAGAQTAFQMMLLVGESSGATGEEVDCESNCLDFPNDIRFTGANGQTKHDYWVESITGTTPNRLAAIWIEVATIPAVGLVDLYMYYGKSADTGESDGGDTFLFFDDFGMEWSPYSGNPILTPTGLNTLNTWGSVWKEGATYHHYYTCSDGTNHKICHGTSTDGKTVTKDSANNPVLDISASGWDDQRVWCPIVWKEGAIWYMLYSGDTSGGDIQVGLATSSNGVTWTKDGSNPVLTTSASGWDSAQAEGWGLIKIGSTYYLWYGTVSVTRSYGLATSTNLTSWTKDGSNPLFTNDRFCPAVFKYGSYYYLIIAHYTIGADYSEFELYRDTNPTFYSTDRTFLGVKKRCEAGTWDALDEDTPWVLADDITQTLLSGDELWVYYGGANASDVWGTGIIIETDIDKAVAAVPIAWTKYQPGACTVKLNSTIKKHGDYSYKFHDPASGDGPQLETADISKSSGIIGAWMRTTNSTGSGTEHFDLYVSEGATLKLTVGFNDGTKKFHYWDGSFHDTAITYSVDTWYLVTIEFDCATDKFNFVVYDTGMSEVCRVDNISFGSVATVLDKIKFFATSNYVGDAYADAFRFRKYASPEPTLDAWGGEEGGKARSYAFIIG